MFHDQGALRVWLNAEMTVAPSAEIFTFATLLMNFYVQKGVGGQCCNCRPFQLKMFESFDKGSGIERLRGLVIVRTTSRLLRTSRYAQAAKSVCGNVIHFQFGHQGTVICVLPLSVVGLTFNAVVASHIT